MQHCYVYKPSESERVFSNWFKHKLKIVNKNICCLTESDK